jgi:putative transposase
LDERNIPPEYWKATAIEAGIQRQMYQMSLWHKQFADLLTIGVIVKRHLQTDKVAQVVLFSSDARVGYEPLIDSYRLRFPLEFHLRDAKQSWGLAAFMSVKERPVYKSANFAMCMVNVSQALMRPMRGQWPAFSVKDLKAWFRGRTYVIETLRLLPELPDSFFIDQVVAHMAELGWVNPAVNPA